MCYALVCCFVKAFLTALPLCFQSRGISARKSWSAPTIIFFIENSSVTQLFFEQHEPLMTARIILVSRWINQIFGDRGTPAVGNQIEV
jgi:hypothetical protein